MFLYDETIHVPLLLKLPDGRFGGRRVESRVALAEVAPTLLDAARISAPAAMQAHSLFPLIEATPDATKPARDKNKKTPERSIYSETN
jgi:arylsulfatase A-like enzyme